MIRRRLLNTAIAKWEEGINPNYLTIVALEDGLTASFSNACEYKIMNGVWISLAASTATPSVNTGEYIAFRATGLTPSSDTGIGKFTVSKSFDLEGNCMSMLFGSSASSAKSLSGKSHAFRAMFKGSKVRNVAAGFLPATTLATYCYREMFQNCTSLLVAPELPATALQEACYSYMFYGCTKLISIPNLPAKTAKQSCYNNMFYNCDSITVAPVLGLTTTASQCCRYMFRSCNNLTRVEGLLATTLSGSYCYGNMFSDCAKLSYVRALFTTTPSSSLTGSWMSGVASAGTFVKNAAATWDVTGANGVPSGWTIQTE